MIHDLILSTPYTLRVLATLALILLLFKYLKNLAIAGIAGTVLLALWCGHRYDAALAIAWGKLSAVNTIMLIVAVTQIILLSTQMSRAGVMKELVEAIRSMVPQRMAIALLPAMIGLLPMPGGAVFSAPLVEQCDSDGTIDPMLKTKINYWFRHLWEYWWPLYPGVLLAVDITGLPIPAFMAVQMPLSLAALGAGYFIFLRRIPGTGIAGGTATPGSVVRVIRLLMPIVIIVISYTLIMVFLPGVRRCNKYLPMIIGIFLAQVWLQAARPVSIRQWKGMLLSAEMLKLLLVVLSILVYGSFIEAALPDGSTLVGHMRDELGSVGVPVMAIIIAVPFLSGLSIGLAIGFVGASFPIVMSLIGSDPAPAVLLSTTVLAFGAGYTGMILSPVHICLIVSNDHFGTDLAESILGLLPAASLLMGSAVLLHFFVRAVL
ncbi:MAG: DUF401 family protein [Spirochaetes bacterium]|nr:DUF401 family protein [Spirochaetota bacterium]